MAEVMKRLEEIEEWATSHDEDDPSWLEQEHADVRWLLKLTRALLGSQWELMERVGNQECHCGERVQRNVWVSECPRCKVLARAEKVRKGEV